MTTLLAFDGDFTIRAPTSISGIMTFVTISVFLTEKKTTYLYTGFEFIP